MAEGGRQSLIDPDGRSDMLERNDGSIVIISSIGGLKAPPVIDAYNVSKAAEIQVGRNLHALWDNPLGRIGEADEIAGADFYLASKAGSFMTSRPSS
jgi:short chain dehydrogenase